MSRATEGLLRGGAPPLLIRAGPEPKLSAAPRITLSEATPGGDEKPEDRVLRERLTAGQRMRLCWSTLMSRCAHEGRRSTAPPEDIHTPTTRPATT